MAPEEKELCSESRVLPEIYLEIKEVLVAECQKTNGLRLADARYSFKPDFIRALLNLSQFGGRP